MDRRYFLKLAGTVATQSAIKVPLHAADAATDGAQHLALRIAPASVELAPGVTIKTIGYNGQVPGPILRMREGFPVDVDVTNATDSPELVYWHGLQTGSLPDDMMEESSPMIAPGGHRRYSFTPRPSGTRWYHTLTMARENLAAATYSGQYGFLMVEGREDTCAYDREVFLAVHHWEPALTRMSGGSADSTGVTYQHASFNDKLLGAGEPIRVRAGERVLFHLLNASATEDVMLALPGHSFTVLALDGNPVPRPAKVQVISLAVGERVDAIVEMNAPGVWVLGSLRDRERAIGLGAVVEYAGQQGAPRWIAPPAVDWSYVSFGNAGHGDLAESERIPPQDIFNMVFEKASAPDGIDRWTINGKSQDQLTPLKVRRGERYRFRFVNASDSAHPVHLHRHNFELKRVAQMPTSGIIKDTINLGRYDVAEADFVANNPGRTLFHCPQQLHMDHGFMQVIEYS